MRQIDIRRHWYEWRRDLKLRLGWYDRDQIRRSRKIVCFSHHKCATKTIGQIWEAICDCLGLNCFWGYHPVMRRGLAELTERYHVIFLHSIKPGDYPNGFKNFDFKGFHVIRDPRSILVSQYFSHRYTHEINRFSDDIRSDRAFLQGHSAEEGLLYIVTRSRIFLRTMDAFDVWNFNDSRLLEFRFENFVADQPKHWRQVLTFTGLSLADEDLDRILARYSFDQLKKRSRKVDAMSHYRSQNHRDYQRFMTPRLKDEFKKHFGKLLVKLGYERDDNW